jgi:glutamate/aspartate transport system permease protein
MIDVGILVRNAGFLADGLKLSLSLTATGVLGGLAIGTSLTIIRQLGGSLSNLCVDVYVFLFRAIPLVLVLFWFYFMMPLLLGRPVGAYLSAVVAFALFEGAYYSEIIRAGILSVRIGQTNAGLATGMRRIQVLRHIVFPQAFRAMIPVFLTQAIILFQDTSLVFVVSLHDFLTSASIVANNSGRLIELYGFACAVYYLICLVASWLAARLRWSTAT